MKQKGIGAPPKKAAKLASSTSTVLSPFFLAHVLLVPFSMKAEKPTLHKSMASDINVEIHVPDDPVNLKTKSVEVPAHVVILALLKELSAISLRLLTDAKSIDEIEAITAKPEGARTNIALMNTGGGFWDKRLNIIGLDGTLIFNIASKGGRHNKTYAEPAITIYVPAANSNRLKRLILRCMIEMGKGVNDEENEDDAEGKDERPSKEEINRRLEELQDIETAPLRLQVAGRTLDVGSRDLCYSQVELGVITALDSDRPTYIKAADCHSITKGSGAKAQGAAADTQSNALTAGFGSSSSSSSSAGKPQATNSKANQAKSSINSTAAGSAAKVSAFLTAVQNMVASKYPTHKQLFDALFPDGNSKQGFTFIKNHGDMCRVIANAYGSKFSEFKSTEVAKGEYVLELPDSFPFIMINGAVQFKAARGIDDYDVLVAMHDHGLHAFKIVLSTNKPPTSMPVHAAHAMVPAVLAQPLVKAAGFILSAAQQAAIDAGHAKSCPLCETVSGTAADTCRICEYKF